ncbi:uncharacterized protein VTP21DRAFT_20 [Calcarisporiella thermophila]|uniref:uncharacterized protein n=1 Tax=Calcarisporiella thermophila TaxID=911321 RepID=UPI003743B18D
MVNPILEQYFAELRKIKKNFDSYIAPTSSPDSPQPSTSSPSQTTQSADTISSSPKVGIHYSADSGTPSLTLPPEPERPGPDDCCGSGCDPCCYDIYREEMEEWRKEVDRLKEEFRVVCKHRGIVDIENLCSDGK